MFSVSAQEIFVHANSGQKSNMEIVWTAPKQNAGSLDFRYHANICSFSTQTRGCRYQLLNFHFLIVQLPGIMLKKKITTCGSIRNRSCTTLKCQNPHFEYWYYYRSKNSSPDLFVLYMCLFNFIVQDDSGFCEGNILGQYSSK